MNQQSAAWCMYLYDRKEGGDEITIEQPCILHFNRCWYNKLDDMCGNWKEGNSPVLNQKETWENERTRNRARGNPKGRMSISSEDLSSLSRTTENFKGEEDSGNPTEALSCVWLRKLPWGLRKKKKPKPKETEFVPKERWVSHRQELFLSVNGTKSRSPSSHSKEFLFPRVSYQMCRIVNGWSKLLNWHLRILCLFPRLISFARQVSIHI